MKPVVNAAGPAEDAFLLKNQEYGEINNLELTNTGDKPAVRLGVHVDADNCRDLRHIYLRWLTVHDVNGDDTKINGDVK